MDKDSSEKREANLMRVLVTGGAGYIGSHTCVELLQAGYDVVVYDNLSNSSEESLKRVQDIAGKALTFIKGDICDERAVKSLFEQNSIDAVIHFAGLKAVGESVKLPIRYYHNNVQGSLVLFDAMAKAGVFNLVFSSSATVYGDPETVPIKEHFPLSATNPYGRSKLMIEDIVRDLGVSDDRWQATLLRYFNPVGAHSCGRIGEDPSEIPNNLMPYVTQVAVGKLEQLSIFGSDYPTPDGTGVRDYIHVVDLAKGHLAALEYLNSKPGVEAINLGTGNGYSVLDMVKAFESETGQAVPYQLVERRPGDIATCYADPENAASKLNWRAENGIEEMVRDAWRWQSNNPSGY